MDKIFHKKALETPGLKPGDEFSGFKVMAIDYLNNTIELEKIDPTMQALSSYATLTGVSDSISKINILGLFLGVFDNVTALPSTRKDGTEIKDKDWAIVRVDAANGANSIYIRNGIVFEWALAITADFLSPIHDLESKLNTRLVALEAKKAESEVSFNRIPTGEDILKAGMVWNDTSFGVDTPLRFLSMGSGIWKALNRISLRAIRVNANGTASSGTALSSIRFYDRDNLVYNYGLWVVGNRSGVSAQSLGSAYAGGATNPPVNNAGWVEFEPAAGFDLTKGLMRCQALFRTYPSTGIGSVEVHYSNGSKKTITGCGIKTGETEVFNLTIPVEFDYGDNIDPSLVELTTVQAADPADTVFGRISGQVLQSAISQPIASNTEVLRTEISALGVYVRGEMLAEVSNSGSRIVSSLENSFTTKLEDYALKGDIPALQTPPDLKPLQDGLAALDGRVVSVESNGTVVNARLAMLDTGIQDGIDTANSLHRDLSTAQGDIVKAVGETSALQSVVDAIKVDVGNYRLDGLATSSALAALTPTVAKKSDLDSYLKIVDLPAQQALPDMASYVLKSDIPAQQPATTVMQGATGVVAGVSGLVPPPGVGDNTKILYGDGTWKTPPLNLGTATFTSEQTVASATPNTNITTTGATVTFNGLLLDNDTLEIVWASGTTGAINTATTRFKIARVGAGTGFNWNAVLTGGISGNVTAQFFANLASGAIISTATGAVILRSWKILRDAANGFVVPTGTSAVIPRNITGSGITALTGRDNAASTVGITGIPAGMEVTTVTASGGATVTLGDSGRTGTAWVDVIPNGADTIISNAQSVWQRQAYAVNVANNATVNVNNTNLIKIDAKIAQSVMLTVPSGNTLTSVTATNATITGFSASGHVSYVPNNAGDVIFSAGFTASTVTPVKLAPSVQLVNRGVMATYGTISVFMPSTGNTSFAVRGSAASSITISHHSSAVWSTGGSAELSWASVSANNATTTYFAGHNFTNATSYQMATVQDVTNNRWYEVVCTVGTSFNNNVIKFREL